MTAREALAPAVATPDGAEDEQWGRVGTLLTEVGGEGRTAGRLSRSALHHHTQRTADDQAGDRPEVIVLASGNLAHVYFPRHIGRLTIEEIEVLYPRLLAGLVEHPGIGIAMTRSKSDGPVVIGKTGFRYLSSGQGDGADPVAPYGPHAAADLRRHDSLPNVGDIVLISRVDAGTDEVAPFEELVGCHGGLGGWQTRAVLVHPTDWPIQADPAGAGLIGADAVHRQLVQWLRHVGRT
jgi:hypothetical protein